MDDLMFWIRMGLIWSIGYPKKIYWVMVVENWRFDDEIYVACHFVYYLLNCENMTCLILIKVIIIDKN